MRKVKKYEEGGLLREGRARFGDDIRERAARFVQQGGAALSDEEAAAMMGRPTRAASKPVRRPAPKIEDTTSKGMTGPEMDLPQTPRSMGIPRDVMGRVDYGMSADSSPEAREAAAEVRKQSWEKKGPLGDFLDALGLGIRKRMESGGFGAKRPTMGEGMKKGGKVKKMASGGKVSSASKRGDGIAQRGKTRGRMC